MFDDAVLCVKCGCPTNDYTSFYEQDFDANPRSSSTITAIKVFMIIGTVLMALMSYGIGLAWCIPMTISYYNKIKRGEPIGTAFKICTLLFVSLIAGVLMISNNDQ